MLDAAYQGLTGILQPWTLFLMTAAVVVSSVLGAIPGIGGLLAITLVLPYVATLSAYEAIALLLGIAAVSNTANTFPSVLIAVPGSVGSQATIVDGFPMAKNGEAKRAFGAAFIASAMGGVFGAFVLLASIPILRPLVLSLGSPEFLVLVIWGLSAVGVLSGNAPIKGFLAAILGVLIATVGTDDKTAIERFAFGGTYLWDGIDIVILGLGVFAVPELVDLAIRRGSIAEVEKLGSGLWQGIKDVFNNKWLVIRCSIVGVWVGALPGMGSTVADWFAYAHAVQTEKDPERFGKGDVRGVIAPESSNNAKEGGSLIPTIAFGIPGSTAYAIILVGFIAADIQPGARMLTDQLHLTLAMVWVLVIANVMGAGLSLGLSGTFARISLLPFYVVVPTTLVLCVAASFTANFSSGDLVTFLVFSLVGCLMKRFGWPRPPFIVAAVLGNQMERYLWLSIARFGFAWLLHPGVILLGLLIVITLGIPLLRQRGNQRTENLSEQVHGHRVGNLLFTGALIVLLGFATSIAVQWPLRAALIVYSLAGIGIPLGLVQMGLDVRGLKRDSRSPSTAYPASEGKRRTLEIYLWFLGLMGGIFLLGFHLTLPVFSAVYARVYGAGWMTALFIALLGEGFLVLVFDQFLHVIWPDPILLWFWL